VCIVVDTLLCRSLIANFEFDLAYEGQVPKPTAAVTMSKSGHVQERFFYMSLFFSSRASG